MKYKVGDKVRIVSERTGSMASSGAMDKYLGTIMTIKDADAGRYSMEEDDAFWCWSDGMIESTKQTPYSYLIEYYGLEEGKKYNCNLDANRRYAYEIKGNKIYDDTGDELINNCFSPSKSIQFLLGNATFTEIPQKKTVTLELTDEQLEQIKKIIE